MIPDYQRAADMAYRTLTSLKISTLPIDPLMILQKCKNTSIHTFDELMERFGVNDPFDFKTLDLAWAEAFTIRKTIGNRVIHELFYDSSVRTPRGRFTLAHELGHIVLNHSCEEAWEEKEANHYAAQLLAPRPVLTIFSIFGYDITDPKFVAKAFRISKSAAEIAANPRSDFEMNDLYRSVADQFIAYVESCSPFSDAV